jgi:hypothetical protein
LRIGSFEAAPAPEIKERSNTTVASKSSSTGTTIDSKLQNSSRMIQPNIEVTPGSSPVLAYSKTAEAVDPVPILSREEKAIELARRKEERRQVCQVNLTIALTQTMNICNAAANRSHEGTKEATYSSHVESAICRPSSSRLIASIGTLTRRSSTVRATFVSSG